MNAVLTCALYVVSLGLLILSAVRDRRKTVISLRRAWRMFLNVLPQFAAILFLVGLLMTALSPTAVRRIIGADSGVLGMLFAAVLGSVTLVPAIVAFPIAEEMLGRGAGLMQIAVFISTLTTVGLVTLPLEMKYLGAKAAILRNLLAFLVSFAVAAMTGVILS